jgi:hypothetical protein
MGRSYFETRPHGSIQLNWLKMLPQSNSLSFTISIERLNIVPNQKKGVPIYSTKIGYVQLIDMQKLQDIAKNWYLITLNAVPGTLIALDIPLFYVGIENKITWLMNTMNCALLLHWGHALFWRRSSIWIDHFKRNCQQRRSLHKWSRNSHSNHQQSH